jgi:hypothetical protein
MRVRIKVPVPPDLWAEVRDRGQSGDGFEVDQLCTGVVGEDVGTSPNAWAKSTCGRA